MGFWASANLDNEQKNAQTFGGSKGADGALEAGTRARTDKLGQGQQQTTIPPWLQKQYDDQKAWAAAARASQQDAYNKAMAQAMGGVTPQQQQLAQSQTTADAAQLGAAKMATGGARGGAAAQGTALGILGANQAGNAAQMNAQQQADMLQGQALAAQAADALRGNDQTSLNAENQFAAQNAQNNLNWRDLNDAWRLWAATQGQKMDLAKMGMTTFGQNADFQNFLRNQQATNQAVGLGAQALGGAASAYGAYANNPENKNMYSDERVKTKRYGKSKDARDMTPSRRALESLRLLASGEGGDADETDASRSARDSLRLLAAGEGGDIESDRRTKTKLRDSDEIADSFLGALRDSRATYNYTDKKYEPSTRKGSRYLGIMAQSVEKVPEIGRGIVTELDGVKRVETLPMLSAVAGALGRLVERVEKVEGK